MQYKQICKLLLVATIVTSMPTGAWAQEAQMPVENAQEMSTEEMAAEETPAEEKEEASEQKEDLQEEIAEKVEAPEESVSMDAAEVAEKTYTVTWKTHGKTYTGKVKEYAKASFEPGEVPSYVEGDSLYTFKGWWPQVVDKAMSDREYTAQYTKSSRFITVRATEKGFKIRKYVLDDGVSFAKGLTKIGSRTYVFDENGETFSGWKKVSGKWYYQESDGVKTGWFTPGVPKLGSRKLKNASGQTVSVPAVDVKKKELYYLGDDGVMRTGWQKVNGFWYYLNPSGTAALGWKKVGGAWHYLDPATGIMKIGWVKDGKTWYYTDGSGRIIVNRWMKINGRWYYFTGSGAMKTGWMKENGKWYYLDRENGNMRIGWFSDGSKRYHANGSGVMEVSKWIKENGVWYYVGSSGAAVSGWQKVGGKNYRFNGDGSIAAFINKESPLKKSYWDLSGVLPPHAVKRFYSGGFKLKFTTSAINGNNLLSGLYSGDITIRSDKAGNSTMLHEFGHYMEHMVHKAGTPSDRSGAELKKIYQKESKNMVGIFKDMKDSYGAYSGKDEFFATGFAAYYYSATTRDRLQKKCPQLYAYIEKVVAVYPDYLPE